MSKEDELKLKKKEYDKNYRIKNKEKIKEYYKKNKEIRSIKRKEYYENNKDKLKEYSKIYKENNKDKKIKHDKKFYKNKKKKHDERILKYLRNDKFKCSKCKIEHKESFLFDWHHLDPSKKEYKISSMRSNTDEELKIELDKCILLCSNCHRILHYELKLKEK